MTKLTFPKKQLVNVQQQKKEMIPVRPSQQYIPRVYGFKINQTSLYFRNHEDDAENRGGGGRNNRRVSRSRQGGGSRR